MAKIIEITESHIIVLENNIKMKISIDAVKFEPRINDIITLVRNEQGNITNIFLEYNEPQPVIIQEQPKEEQPVVSPKPSKAIFASKFVSIYSIVFWSIMALAISVSIKDPSIFIEEFNKLELDISLIPVSLYIILALSVLMIVFGILLLSFKNIKRKFITIIPLFIVYALFIFVTPIYLIIDPSTGFALLLLFGTPFYYSVKFLKEYRTL